MPARLSNRTISWLDGALAKLGDAFIRGWGKLERSYRRPAARVASRLKFAFYPLLALGAIGWLAWDWQHDRSLNSAENAIFDSVIRWRPVDPRPSGRVVVVEIDECSIEYFRARGEGGWPWSRQRHADLLDQLDRGGARAVGYDVLLTDPSVQDPGGDTTLEAMARGGGGRFLFGSTRLHPDYDAAAPLRASQVPGAFALRRPPRDDPRVALLLPYGQAMREYSAIVNVTRGEGGVIRDVPLLETTGDWAIPSLPLRLAVAPTARPAHDAPASVRPNWRQAHRLPRISAADVLVKGESACRDKRVPLPVLQDSIVLVGYTAAGLNDAKPTPVDPVMPGVEILAEATEALVAGSAIRTPPAWFKYALAATLVLFTTFAFYRSEPANDIDSIFVATNLGLLIASFVGLTFFSFFFDIFAAVGFISLVFGLCRAYAGVQRGRAIGHGDFLQEYDPAQDRWLAAARLRFVADRHLDQRQVAWRRREYRRRLRRFLYAGSDAVMLEGVVERKTWLHDSLSDLMVLVWHGESRESVLSAATRDLQRLEQQLVPDDVDVSDDDGVRIAFASAEVAAATLTGTGAGCTIHEFLGELLASSTERPLRRLPQETAAANA